MNCFKYLICLFLFVLLYSCEEEENVPQTKEKPMLALNSLIGVDSSIHVNLTMSTDLYEESHSITDAIITLYKNKQSLGQLNHKSNGNYEYPNYHLEGQTNYEISVIHPDFAEIKASTISPEKVIIDKVEQINNYKDGKTTFTLNFSDDPTKNDYYMLLVKGVSADFSQLLNYYSNDIVFEGNLAVNETDFEQNMLAGSRSFSDENSKSSQLTISFYLLNDEISTDISEYRIELYHLSKDYYNYERSYVAIENRDNLPFYNKTRLYSNIEGAFGIFSSYSLDLKTISKQ
ncbi:DUF4249 domain-containing protein [Marinifilum sp. RC60d5]|uniref:DUF4249 domain-containing protein n=1 Tax=Marinifilum sp. RC60d5 TaxID=3458414 RepID=UPI004036D357